MTIDDLKSLIIQQVEASNDIKYLIAVNTFANTYPDKSRMEKISCPPNVVSSC